MTDVKNAINYFTKRFNLHRMPLYLWGISSGAGFAVKVPMAMPISGVVSGELLQRKQVPALLGEGGGDACHVFEWLAGVAVWHIAAGKCGWRADASLSASLPPAATQPAPAPRLPQR